MRPTSSAAAPVTYATLPASGVLSAMVDIVRVVNDVVQVIDRDRRDRELAAVASQPTPRPCVGRDVVVGVGHRPCRIDEFGRDDGGSCEA